MYLNHETHETQYLYFNYLPALQMSKYKLSTVIASVTMTMLQDKLLAKMDNEEEEKMPYSADDQVFGHDSYSVTNNFRI